MWSCVCLSIWVSTLTTSHYYLFLHSGGFPPHSTLKLGYTAGITSLLNYLNLNVFLSWSTWSPFFKILYISVSACTVFVEIKRHMSRFSSVDYCRLLYGIYEIDKLPSYNNLLPMFSQIQSSHKMQCLACPSPPHNLLTFPIANSCWGISWCMTVFVIYFLKEKHFFQRKVQVNKRTYWQNHTFSCRQQIYTTLHLWCLQYSSPFSSLD